MKDVFPKVKECCKTFSLKTKEFYKKHRKGIITVMAVGVIAAAVVAGAVCYHAKSNMKYSQEQLQKIALEKVPGEVVKVDKELNFRHATFDYVFKIRDKDNMLETVRMDSQYGAIVRVNDENHGRGHKGMHAKGNKGRFMDGSECENAPKGMKQGMKQDMKGQEKPSENQ